MSPIEEPKNDSSQGMSASNQGRWDRKTQTYHGGQDWRNLSNFIEDFSVTTNGLGTPVKALYRAKEAINHMHHYPAADFEPALTDLAHFLWPNVESEEVFQQYYKSKLLLGNGASELIDLVIRQANRNKDTGKGKWIPGPTAAQYMEYQRSATAAGFDRIELNDYNEIVDLEAKQDVGLMCCVNPTNPTGDYMNIQEMKDFIEKIATPGMTIIVDESMQPWLGPQWREDSLIHQRDWCEEMANEKQIYVWVMTSWTKIWSCTGIRLGSVVAPTAELLTNLKKKQVPWSVNCVALDFLSEVVKDDEYLEQTWALTTKWNVTLREKLAARFPTWKIYGKLFLSWVWIECPSEDICQKAVELASIAGVPIRSAGPGYNMPTFFRIAVRPDEPTDILLNSWKSLEH